MELNIVKDQISSANLVQKERTKDLYTVIKPFEKMTSTA